MTFSDSDATCDWPTLESLRELLDIPDGFTQELEVQLATAIDQTKIEVGDWDELVDMPDCDLANAATRLAVLIRANSADLGAGVITPAHLTRDPIFQASMRGHRTKFSIA